MLFSSARVEYFLKNFRDETSDPISAIHVQVEVGQHFFSALKQIFFTIYNLESLSSLLSN
jgi:hypothetical protein